ncbi:hypothetical protein K439DRAFT_1254911, partial [Ramaria rubella]
HLEATHKGLYLKWVKETPDAINKLPKHLAKLKADVKAAGVQPTSVTDHSKPVEPMECVVPYSDDLFRQVTCEWLVATDQPIQALEHPWFKELIEVASHAKNGVRV